MHETSIQKMKMFVKKYLDKNRKLVIYDIGAAGFKNYRKCFKSSKWKYFGVDLNEGENVDIVLKNPYKWDIKDDSADVVVSGQCFEHIEFFG